MHRGRMCYSETKEKDEHDDQVLVSHFQFPNTKTVTQKPSQPVTLSSQDTLGMTNPLVAAESTTASARRNSIGRNATSRENPFSPNYQAGPSAIPDALVLAQTRVAAGVLTLAKTRVVAGPTPGKRGLRR